MEIYQPLAQITADGFDGLPVAMQCAVSHEERDNNALVGCQELLVMWFAAIFAILISL